MEIDERLLLVEALRDALDLKGTHIGCLTGDCGACTVELDGQIVKSCLLLAVQAEGSQVVTIEGIAHDGQLTLVQQAFWDEYGFQCGYCLPAACSSPRAELLDQNPDPTEQEIRDALDGNLCRCTGYEFIVKAGAHGRGRDHALALSRPPGMTRRRHVEHLPRPGDRGRSRSAWPGWPAGAADEAALARRRRAVRAAALLLLPDGWRRPPAAERLRLRSGSWSRAGSFRSAASRAPESAPYSLSPAGAGEEARLDWQARTSCLFAARSGPPDVRSRQHGDAARDCGVAAERLPWGPTPIPNGPPNIELAMLRRTESGGMSALVRGGPRRFPVYEFHDCVEECFLLDGDIMIGPGGQMLAGTYFWRPPYLTHGQSRCERSSLLYVYTDSALVNHTTDALQRTRPEGEPGRAQAEREASAAAPSPGGG